MPRWRELAPAARLDGAACDELAPQVRAKFFEAPRNDTIRRKAAQNICGRCIVAPECLDNALNGPFPPKTGIIAGVPAAQIHNARSWINYELGITDHPPYQARPEWLQRSDASEMAEHTRLLAEVGDE